MTFTDRRDAGRQLVPLLQAHRHAPDALVLGLPRGGVVVAGEVARALGLPLDVLVVRKLGHPARPAAALGAIASGGVQVMQPAGPGDALPPEELAAVLGRETIELVRRETAYRTGRPPLVLEGRTVLLVDDGVATGATLRAAVQAVRRRGAAHVVAAVPVGDPAVCQALQPQLDALVCLRQPQRLYSVGAWYGSFPQVTDAQVREALRQGAGTGAG